MICVDTNIIVRFLTHDDDQQYKKAYSIFDSYDVFISDTVVVETEWVLRYVYDFSPEDICNAFISLFGHPSYLSKSSGQLLRVEKLNYNLT